MSQVRRKNMDNVPKKLERTKTKRQVSASLWVAFEKNINKNLQLTAHKLQEGLKASLQKCDMALIFGYVHFNLNDFIFAYFVC